MLSSSACARRVLRARVLVALVAAELFLDVGRRLEDGRDDRAGRRVGLLAGVDADGREARVGGEFHTRHLSDQRRKILRAVEPSRDAAPVGQYDSLLSFDFQIGMASRRLADTPTPARRRQAPPSLPAPPDDSGRTARDLLLSSWPGRLFIVAAIFKILVASSGIVGELPAFLQVLSTAATIALAFSVLFFLTRLVFLVQRRLLWRVRRKLILSYIFIGVVPALLILGFFLLGGWIRRRHGRGVPVPGRLRRRHAPGAAAGGGGGRRDRRARRERPTRRSNACSATARRRSATRRCRSRSFLPRRQRTRRPVSRGPWEHLRGLTRARRTLAPALGAAKGRRVLPARRR